jgi:hypothetical protein
MSDEPIRTEHFTLTAGDGGIYIPKVHHSSGAGFDTPVDPDWDHTDGGPVDDPDPATTATGTSGRRGHPHSRRPRLAWHIDNQAAPMRPDRR